MKSQPSGPFKSRALSRVVRWAQRWWYRGQVTWRTAKQVTGWTAQILVYPLYAAFQAGRLVRLRLQQARETNHARQHRLLEDIDTGQLVTQERSPQSDHVVQRLLTVVRQVVLPQLPGWQETPILNGSDVWIADRRLLGTAAPYPLVETDPTQPLVPGTTAIAQSSLPVGTIRGLASVIRTRSLVLVSDQNTVLDILTPTQQAWLQEVIAWEVVHFVRVRRLRDSLHRLAWIPRPDEGAPWWVRGYLRLMAWMASTPVAIAANLFYEAEAQAYLAAEAEPFDSIGATQSHPDGVFELPILIESPVLEPLQVAIAPTTRLSPQIEKLKQPTVERNLSHSSDSDYIDTSVSLVGYVQSPFEQFLRWVDRCLLWVEGIFTKLWQRFQA